MESQQAREARLGRLLADGFARGRWTLEALDPRPGTPAHLSRNLAREWIEANPEEFALIMTRAADAEARKNGLPEMAAA